MTNLQTLWVARIWKMRLRKRSLLKITWEPGKRVKKSRDQREIEPLNKQAPAAAEPTPTAMKSNNWQRRSYNIVLAFTEIIQMIPKTAPYKYLTQCTETQSVSAAA